MMYNGIKSVYFVYPTLMNISKEIMGRFKDGVTSSLLGRDDEGEAAVFLKDAR
jgi:hypothetical protein